MNWLQKACYTSKDPSVRAELQRPHGDYASNGMMAFRDPTEGRPPCNCEKCRGYYIQQIVRDASKQTRTIVNITTAALVTSCKQAIAIGRGANPRDDYIPTMLVSVNESLQTSARSEGNGENRVEWTDGLEWETSSKTDFPIVSSYRLHKSGTKFSRVRVTYQHKGEDMTFGINPKFLLVALSGMDDNITVKAQAPNGPIYITDGTREAVIMPIKL